MRIRAAVGAASTLMVAMVCWGGPSAASTSVSWTAQTLSIHADTGQLNVVSCATTSRCVAVGSDQGATNGYFSEVWNGSDWSIHAMAHVASGKQLTFAAVSCPSAGSDCAAVGHSVNSTTGADTPMAQYWNGSSWVVQTTSTPKGGTSDLLSGVGCISGTECLAVGSYTSPGGVGRLLALVGDGTTWTQVAPSTPKAWTGASFSGVSCAGDTCTAVGSYQTSGASGYMAEQWDGTTWTVKYIPLPSGSSYYDVDAIACVAASRCFAVGQYQPSGSSDIDALVEQSTGGSWSALTGSSGPIGVDTLLVSISCSSGHACEALGSGGIIEGWNGVNWTAQDPAAAPADPGLAAVSCVTGASGCTIVGQATASNGFAQTLVEFYSGTSWTTDVSPNPSVLQSGAFTSVTCPTSTTCTALPGPYFEHGSTWTEHSVPGARLDAVSCISSSACMGMTTATDPSGGVQAVAEQWTGSGWITQQMPQPPGVPQPDAQPKGISCTTPTYCVSVGTWYGGGEQLGGFGEVWKGQAWELSYPGGESNQLAMDSVSCGWFTTCMAVGYDSGYGPLPSATAELWNGSVWMGESVPDSEGLSDVSCATRTQCVAVGIDDDGVSSYYVWSGSSWSPAQALPVAPSGGNYQINAISCGEASSCTAVGEYEPASGPATALAISWDGATWSVEPTATLPTKSGSSFSAISCPQNGTSCTATGDEVPAGQTYELPLIETS